MSAPILDHVHSVAFMTGGVFGAVLADTSGDFWIWLFRLFTGVLTGLIVTICWAIGRWVIRKIFKRDIGLDL